MLPPPFRYLLIKRDRYGGGFLEIPSKPCKAGIRLCDVGHDPLAFWVSYRFADRASFFGTMKPILFVPYQFGHWL